MDIAIYIESNVMGTQFGGDDSEYAAVLMITLPEGYEAE